MTDTIKALIMAALVALALGAHFYDKKKAVDLTITATTAKITQVYQKKLDDQIKQAQEVQEALVKNDYENRAIKDAKIKSLTNERNALIVSLRNRDSRPAPTKDNPLPPQVGGSCTGRELYRQDGEFLAGEAARADQAVIDRDYYYNQYEGARLLLEQFRKDVSESNAK
jgi:hypothetical protein